MSSALFRPTLLIMIGSSYSNKPKCCFFYISEWQWIQSDLFLALAHHKYSVEIGLEIWDYLSCNKLCVERVSLWPPCQFGRGGCLCEPGPIWSAEISPRVENSDASSWYETVCYYVNRPMDHLKQNISQAPGQTVCITVSQTNDPLWKPHKSHNTKRSNSTFFHWVFVKFLSLLQKSLSRLITLVFPWAVLYLGQSRACVRDATVGH